MATSRRSRSSLDYSMFKPAQLRLALPNVPLESAVDAPRACVLPDVGRWTVAASPVLHFTIERTPATAHIFGFEHESPRRCDSPEVNPARLLDASHELGESCLFTRLPDRLLQTKRVQLKRRKDGLHWSTAKGLGRRADEGHDHEDGREARNQSEVNRRRRNGTLQVPLRCSRTGASYRPTSLTTAVRNLRLT